MLYTQGVQICTKTKHAENVVQPSIRVHSPVPTSDTDTKIMDKEQFPKSKVRDYGKQRNFS